jgi:membrane-associated phospholipid phosphatase
MAEVLTDRGPRGWWPVDYLIGGYLAVSGLLIAVYRSGIPGSGWLLTAHIIAIGSIWLAASRSISWGWVFRHWYPLPYVASCYKEMSLIIPAVRGRDYDAEMAWLDHVIWGANPTVWLERITFPALTEFLQIAYSLFVPAVLLVAAILWQQRRYPEFRQYAFLIALGFLASYAGYLAVPVRGPRFLLAHLQTFDLRGLWSFQFLQQGLNRLESAHYDCFPSGHTELTILAWWSTRRISKRLFRIFFVYTLCIIFATVYLRYHYTVDIMAGAVLAAVLLVLAPYLHGEKRLLIGRS